MKNSSFEGPLEEQERLQRIEISSSTPRYARKVIVTFVESEQRVWKRADSVGAGRKNQSSRSAGIDTAQRPGNGFLIRGI